MSKSVQKAKAKMEDLLEEWKDNVFEELPEQALNKKHEVIFEVCLTAIYLCLQVILSVEDERGCLYFEHLSIFTTRHIFDGYSPYFGAVFHVSLLTRLGI
jgi:hypothetical protein